MAAAIVLIPGYHTKLYYSCNSGTDAYLNSCSHEDSASGGAVKSKPKPKLRHRTIGTIRNEREQVRQIVDAMLGD